jgi:hypothetical protein
LNWREVAQKPFATSGQFKRLRGSGTALPEIHTKEFMSAEKKQTKESKAPEQKPKRPIGILAGKPGVLLFLVNGK